MSTAERFEIENSVPVEPRQGRSCLSSCLIGCLVMGLIGLVLAAVAGYWLYHNGRDWAASLGSDAIKQGINETGLPEEERDEIKVQVDRFADAFRTGQVSFEQAAKVVENVSDSPLMTLLIASAMERKYIDASELSDEEKVEGRQTLRRFLRGSIDGEIDQPAMDAAMVHVGEKTDGNWQLRERVSDAELRQFFDAAKAAADKAEIPAELDEIDPSDEFKRIIDQALGEGEVIEESNEPVEPSEPAEPPVAPAA